jgi:uncharacterized membrane protein HdeD (DUF308 family)
MEVTMEDRLLNRLGSRWKWMVLRGVAAVIFGIIAFLKPGITLGALTLLFGVYVFADGICALITGFQAREQGQSLWPFLLIGLAGIAAGIFTALRPGITALALLIVIGIWAVAIGLLQIIVAIRIRKLIRNELLLGLSGLLSVIFGLIILVNPGAGALGVVWLIGAYAFAFGILLILLGFRLKGFSNRVEAVAASFSGGR